MNSTDTSDVAPVSVHRPSSRRVVWLVLGGLLAVLTLQACHGHRGPPSPGHLVPSPGHLK
jgi:hypothetical protein